MKKDLFLLCLVWTSFTHCMEQKPTDKKPETLCRVAMCAKFFKKHDQLSQGYEEAIIDWKKKNANPPRVSVSDYEYDPVMQKMELKVNFALKAYNQCMEDCIELMKK